MTSTMEGLIESLLGDGFQDACDFGVRELPTGCRMCGHYGTVLEFKARVDTCAQQRCSVCVDRPACRERVTGRRVAEKRAEKERIAELLSKVVL